MRCAIGHGPRAAQRFAGFTLIELMLVVVVIATLAVIALPSYSDYVRRTRRAEGVTLANQLAQAQERWRGTAATYTNDTSSSGLNVPSTASGFYAPSAVSPARNETNTTIASCPSAAAPSNRDSYSVIATASGSQAGDTACAVLKLNWACGEFRQLAGASLTTLADATTSAAARRCWGR
jgi:type IV pilus assembly protein PilE